MKKLIIPVSVPFLLVAAFGLFSTRSVRISFTGDIIMHIPVKSCALSHNELSPDKKASLNNSGFDFLFERIKGYLAGSAVTVGNMEFPVSSPFTSSPRIFNCHPDIVKALKKAGFTLLHIGNNHILDQGSKGVLETMKHLAENGLDYIGIEPDPGTGRAGIVKTIQGIRIGIIGYTGVLNYARPRNPKGYRLGWFYDKKKVEDDISDIRKRCDYLVMVAHVGDEYDLIPQTRDSALMRHYIRCGVDLIVGHHPHLIQPVERVDRGDGSPAYIFYSLGNFISNQSSKKKLSQKGLYLSTRDSVILHCHLERSLMNDTVRARFEILPIRTVNSLGGPGRKRSIQTVAIGDELSRLKRMEGNPEKSEAIRRKIESLRMRLAAIKKALFKSRETEDMTFIEP